MGAVRGESSEEEEPKRTNRGESIGPEESIGSIAVPLTVTPSVPGLKIGTP